MPIPSSASTLRLLDDETMRRWRGLLLGIGTASQLTRAAQEIRALFAATAELREANAVNLAKLRDAYEIRRNIIGRG